MSTKKNRLQLQRPEKFEIGYIKRITQQFSPELIIGRGGFGTVYKGEKDDGKFIAVKMLNQTIAQMDDTEFKKEVLNLWRISHPNIVRLEGYCIDTDEELITHDGKHIFAENRHRLICFEFLPGSLHEYLNNDKDKCRVPNWKERYNIIKGICKGLHHLHEGLLGGKHILHLDLKPANVLLDKDMIPKIADFGQSRLLQLNEGQTHTQRIVGTPGYMAPEYMGGGAFGKKTDVYCLGVIIMEIIAGKGKYPDEQLHEFVREKWKERTSYEEYKQVQKCIELALGCMNEKPEERHDMKGVIEFLGISEDDMDHHPDGIEEHSVVNIHSSEVDPLLEQQHGLLQRCATLAVERNSPPKILKSSRTAVTVRTSIGTALPDIAGAIGLVCAVLFSIVGLFWMWSSMFPSREKTWTMFSIVVEDATFTRFDLETSSSSSSPVLTYNISVMIDIYKPNRYIPKVSKPLEASFFFGDQRFHVVRLVGNNVYLEATTSINLGHAAATTVNLAPVSGNMTLDTAGVAEYRNETPTGLYKVELRLAGQLMYSDTSFICNVRATCPTICDVQATCPFKLRLAPPEYGATELELIGLPNVKCPLHLNCSSNNRG